jgi:hypothetical protein
MTPADLLMIAERNLRVIAITVDKLLHAEAQSQLRAVEFGLLYLVRRINEHAQDASDGRSACCG